MCLLRKNLFSVLPKVYLLFQLHCQTGGVLQPKFEDTLKWYYERTTNQQDKERCLDLLSKFQQKKKGDVKTVGRPSTAQGLQRQHQHIQADAKSRPKSARPDSGKDQPPATAEIKTKKSAYQRQVEFVNRLSRPQTAKSDSLKYRISYDRSQEYKACPRPKSAMANLGLLMFFKLETWFVFFNCKDKVIVFVLIFLLV